MSRSSISAATPRYLGMLRLLLMSRDDFALVWSRTSLPSKAFISGRSKQRTSEILLTTSHANTGCS